MKKVFSALVLFSFFLVLLTLIIASSAKAQVPSELPQVKVESVSDLQTTITNIAKVFSMVLFAVAAVMLIWAAFLWVTAGGSPENIGKARTMLINALVGAAIGLAAQGFIKLIGNIMGGSVTTT